MDLQEREVSHLMRRLLDRCPAKGRIHRFALGERKNRIAFKDAQAWQGCLQGCKATDAHIVFVSRAGTRADRTHRRAGSPAYGTVSETTSEGALTFPALSTASM